MNPAGLSSHHVQIRGHGPRTLVWAHGFGTDQRAWAQVVPHFDPHHRSVLFDHMGFGHSDRQGYDPRRHGTLDGYASDLVDIVRATAERPVVLVGHSAGGFIGLLAAIQAPALFERLVLIGTSPCFLNHPPDYAGGFERHDIETLLDSLAQAQSEWPEVLVPLALGPERSTEAAEAFGRHLQAHDALIARRFARLIFLDDGRDQLARVQVPSVVIQGLRDAIVPPAVGRYLTAHLLASRLLEIDVSGHCPHLTAPEATVAALHQALALP